MPVQEKKLSKGLSPWREGVESLVKPKVSLSVVRQSGKETGREESCRRGHTGNKLVAGIVDEDTSLSLLTVSLSLCRKNVRFQTLPPRWC